MEGLNGSRETHPESKKRSTKRASRSQLEIFDPTEGEAYIFLFLSLFISFTKRFGFSLLLEVARSQTRNSKSKFNQRSISTSGVVSYSSDSVGIVRVNKKNTSVDALWCFVVVASFLAVECPIAHKSTEPNAAQTRRKQPASETAETYFRKNPKQTLFFFGHVRARERKKSG